MYSVGDRVVVRNDLKKDYEYRMFGNSNISDIVVDSMMASRGQIVTISSVKSKYKIHGDPHWWTDEMFEGYAESDNTEDISDEEFKSLFDELMRG